jgi:hypothetical protein
MIKRRALTKREYSAIHLYRRTDGVCFLRFIGDFIATTSYIICILVYFIFYVTWGAPVAVISRVDEGTRPLYIMYICYYINTLVPSPPLHLFLDLSTITFASSASSDVISSIVKVYKCIHSRSLLYQYMNNNNVYGRDIGISRPYTVAVYTIYKYNIIICVFTTG